MYLPTIRPQTHFILYFSYVKHTFQILFWQWIPPPSPRPYINNPISDFVRGCGFCTILQTLVLTAIRICSVVLDFCTILQTLVLTVTGALCGPDVGHFECELCAN